MIHVSAAGADADRAASPQAGRSRFCVAVHMASERRCLALAKSAASSYMGWAGTLRQKSTSGAPIELPPPAHSSLPQMKPRLCEVIVPASQPQPSPPVAPLRSRPRLLKNEASGPAASPLSAMPPPK
mmetsp:Transcript_64825/g.180440  ORF Transcript_64825/g.180440 Transcript_64825/m.180440 type:complete len:127 (-) Transcript_64825:579-959(-)